MSIVLGFDTAGAWCAAALWSDGAVVEAVAEEMARGQAERLMDLLQELLARHDLTWRNLDALGVGVGPGNFTGIRIGVSAARGLALGLDVPAYGITGFEQRESLQTPPVCVPAPRESVYVMQADGPALVSRSTLEAAGTTLHPDPAPADLAASIATQAAARFPQAAPAPAPYYLRPPDAAQGRDVPPVILPPDTP
ncbi:tRNA (adenosine(37)-N6)-threonylcarbamoyltransferase complex dimerization subunit type 1 TsaB [Pseudosulfitobacter sp. DSM 107133]|jgi:tRNA threonylcarbamoyl adenosine modification protein YeaZ|uniref:tRNA (adenosine(37)-N6)-threonylcarbamoyltransferase complex dimerization subunit type 1 TsaB n=1 Tax=Pseudosulfitobacter sp. DSM 107133 TaxID=2883100 RepID=UPI000DF11F5F|nr:tRNA (adenosine(37)-N6)-threonylcarbamoyltransferase complex dimerization subunit type 1 TsaB [Pseudosulfitobacter sp. DSM 107133]UOA26098.1 tRNA threonylcarbamoyladenosine biosynthesis protein TsaB [Pseudosulfitobacter sp. DSM 107133]